MLELLEESGVDDGEPKADAAFAAKPDDPGLRSENCLAVWQREADVGRPVNFIGSFNPSTPMPPVLRFTP